MEGRITIENIQSLKENEVFVFGSNESGLHGAGAAKDARMYFGAKIGKGFGYHSTSIGKTFAIPTKSWTISKLELSSINHYIDRFIAFARTRPDLLFLVTEIGCGLAGYSVEEISPLFHNTVYLDNIHLPRRFWKHLTREI